MDKKMSEHGVVDSPPSVSPQAIGSVKDIFGSGGEVSIWDFSTANMSKESRIATVQKVASICFQSEVKVGTSALYDKLMAESLGLPSSSFEFVPILLREDDIELIHSSYTNGAIGGDENFFQPPRTEKYGISIVHKGKVYLLTNLRALLYDIAIINASRDLDDQIDPSKNFFNSDEQEMGIISQNFIVFNTKIDIVTARQFMRHRTSWQELSRRYVSGKKVPFEVYLTDDIIHSEANVIVNKQVSLRAVDLVMICIEMYDALIDDGIKPQDARRIIPQGAMTQVWSAWLKPTFDDMVELRSATKAQWEVRTLAKTMSGLVELTR